MKSFKRYAVLIMLLSFIFSTVSPAFASGIIKVTDLQGGGGGSNIKTVKVTVPFSHTEATVLPYDNNTAVYFGNYRQSWDAEKTGKEFTAATTVEKTDIANYKNESIKWRVLANNTEADANGNKGVLLLSDQILYGDNYNEDISKENTGWNQSQVRQTLTGSATNGSYSSTATYEDLKDSFAKDAFSKAEYEALAATTHEAGGSNSNYSGIKSEDKVFLLSRQEAENTAYGFAANTTTGVTADTSRITTATDMSKYITMYDNSSAVGTASLGTLKPSTWGLRSPELNSTEANATAQQVGANGTFGCLTTSSSPSNVRPALNLNQDSVLFLSAAEGGKSEVGVGDGFALNNSYAGEKGWKVTLKDSTINAPTVTAEVNGSGLDVNKVAETAIADDKIMNISGTDQGSGAEELSVNYSEAATGENMYLSALLYDKNDNILNYAKIASTGTEDNGTGKVDLSNIDKGQYKVKFFSEQANDEKQTDFASKFSGAIDIAVIGGSNSILSKVYKDSGLTANLTNGAELGFEDAAYDTKINVTSTNGAITGDAEGTTLNGAIGLAGNMTVNGKITSTGGVTGADGGRIVVTEGSEFIASNVNISNNTYDGNDAAIYNEGTTIINGGEFRNNGATKGGAIYNEENGKVVLDNANFSGNTANGKANDIYNAGTVEAKSGNTFESGIENNGVFNVTGACNVSTNFTGTGTVNIQNGGDLTNVGEITQVLVNIAAGGELSTGVINGNLENSGTVNLTSGTVTDAILESYANVGDAKLNLTDKAVYDTTSGKVFTNALTDFTDDIKSKEDRNAYVAKNNYGTNSLAASKLTYVGGQIELNDSYYTLGYAKLAKKTLEDTGSGSNLVMKGTLVTKVEDDGSQTVLVDALDNNTGDAEIIQDKAMTILTLNGDLLVGSKDVTKKDDTVDALRAGTDLTIRDATSKDIDADRIELANVASGMIVTNGKNVTVGGKSATAATAGEAVTVTDKPLPEIDVDVKIGLDQATFEAVNATLAEGQKLASKTGMFSIGSEADKKYELAGKLTINEGSSATITGQTTIAKTLALNGTETETSTLKITSGEMTVNDSVTAKDATINIAEGSTLNFAKDFIIADGKNEIIGGGIVTGEKIVNNATLTTSAAALNVSKIENNSPNTLEFSDATDAVINYDITMVSGTGDGHTKINTATSDVTITNNGTMTQTLVTVKKGSLVNWEGCITAGSVVIENSGTVKSNADKLIAEITNNGILAYTGGTVSRNITNRGSVTLKTGASFGADGKISGGTAVLKEDVEFTASNLNGIMAFDADKAIYNFSATLNSAAPYIMAADKITVNGNATGTIKLGTIALNGTSSDGWTVGTPKEMQYLNAAGADTNLTVAGYNIQTNTGCKYTFSQAKDGSADKIGYMRVLKESEAELTLKDLVNNTSSEAGSTNQYTVDGLDDTTTENLGALDNTLRDGKFAIVGSSEDPMTDILDGNGKGGITVADTAKGGKAGDILNIVDVTMKNFATAVTNKEGGIVNLENTAFNSAEETDVINDGTLNLSGTNSFVKGINGNGVMTLNDDFTNTTTIKQGKINIVGGKTLSNGGTITADIENAGTIITDAGKISGSVVNNNLLNLTGGIADENISEDKFAKLGSDVTGEGTTVIDGYVNAAGRKLETAVTVNADKGLYIKADGVKKVVANEGLLLLSDGTLTQNITGSGNTSIRGNVEIGTEINQDNIVVETGSLTTNADLIKGGLINNETVNFTGGTLADRYLSIGGTTNFKGKTKFSGEVSLANSTLGFWLDNFSKGDTIIDSANTINVAGTEIKLYQDVEGKKVEKEGDKLTLINNAEGYEGTKDNPLKKKVISNVGMLDYEYDTWLEDGELVIGVQGDTPKPIIKDKTKSFSEARLAGLAAINNGSDLVIGQVIDSVSESDLWEAFAAIQGSHNRYETGSHIDLNSTNVAAGLSKKVKDNVTLGLFVEGGNGRYSTFNEFEENIVRADGDINYFGGGVFAKIEGKKTAKGQLHGEASFRAGHVSSDYNSETFDKGEQIRFDTSQAYLGAHVGIGYKWNITNGGNVDTYVKYLWNRQNNDSPTIAEKKFDLDAINSYRLRAGFRYNGKENTKGIKFFGGLAYEYEFDGVAKGHMGEYALLEPDFKGGSGMAELGIKYDKKDCPWKVELGLTGYTGKRDSIGANLGATYEFGGIKQ